MGQKSIKKQCAVAAKAKKKSKQGTPVTTDDRPVQCSSIMQ